MTFRRALLSWWDHGHRDLPWRQPDPDPKQFFYRVWLSEIMLQQTRVEAVKPYFDRFLARFPDVEALAKAAEPDVLTAWSGLGYYSRARNLHRAAKQMLSSGFPQSYEEVLALPGIGPYTAAAIASIALGLPYAAVDGNVIRVITRRDNDPSEITAASTLRRLSGRAAELLDPMRPGDFNQAMMELGATVCTPRNPACLVCPVAGFCEARAAGTQTSLPVKQKKAQVREVSIDLLVMEWNGSVFLVQRDGAESRLAGFWEIPQRHLLGNVRATRKASFTHQIVNDRMRISVWRARNVPAPAAEGRWFTAEELAAIPLTTVSRKALDSLKKKS